jgi:predicted amidophosphoribosyltransferase
VIIKGGQSMPGVVKQQEPNGTQLPPEPARVPEILQDLPEAQPMLCRSCDAEVGPEDRFCPVCGRHIEVAEETSAHTASFEQAAPQPASEVAPSHAPVQRP